MPHATVQLHRQHGGSPMSDVQLLELNSSPLLTPLAELMDSDEPFVVYNNEEEGDIHTHAFSNSSTQSRLLDRDKYGAESGDGGKCMYFLARVDEATGKPLRRATLKEAQELGRELAATGSHHLLLDYEAGGKNSRSMPAGLSSGKRGSLSNCKGGGPCDHCGTTESPQWRRGPPPTTMLCNACGTRYRRTGNLTPQQNSPGSKSRQMTKRRWDRKDGRESQLIFCEAA